ncbi:DnaB-like helicase C-terminal domain-containing protein [Curvibacter sp. HBC28]|uniref:DNA 5'-3' helicase n=1 Tax=Curvibacter microcysteis TaxID=3026419 RepID=A0ABT5MCG7_9BURK|nr:DnaB-like helicase C-terminal domain-containing protein [Curvibacter sp. HBC28]MDD0814269.1 DnaB-like helicase C-terminal domain-containing protein [Curvibacter sp. HBC28]
MSRAPRQIPASLESEAGLLGGLLLDNEAIQRIPDLDPAAFYSSFHREVYSTIQSLVVEGHPYDTVSVYTRMSEKGGAADLVALNELAQYVPSSTSIRRYAEVVQDRYRSRQLMQVAGEIADLATSTATSAEQIDRAQMLLAKMATVKSRRDPQHIDASIAEYLALLQDLSEGRNPAIPTGISGLDGLLNGGLRRGEVLVLGARPKHGKTALALALARNMARNYSVLFLSQEMAISQLMHRHTAAMGPFDLGRILAARPEDKEMWTAVSDAAHRLGQLNIHHDEQGALTLMEIRRKVMKVRRERGLDVLFVDFLQLMAGAGDENRNRELDIIVNGIKAMSMDLQIATVVLSQMSRKADEHYGPPLMTHLRDSGAIEAAADQVALLFTDWNHPMSKRTDEFKGYSQLDLVAHRNGPQGVVPLHFNANFQQMQDWNRPIPTHKAVPTENRRRDANF